MTHDGRDGATVEVMFFCTGKGSHSRRELGPVVDRRRAGLAEIIAEVTPHAGPLGHRDDLAARQERRRRAGRAGETIVSRSQSVKLGRNKAGERTWEVRCPCGQNRRPSDANMIKLLDAAAAVGGDSPVLDISLWP